MSDMKKILIVDDEPDAVEIVEAMLSEIGDFNVISAGNGVSGLEKSRQEKPDLIILDVQMPKMDGFAVFQELKKDDSTRDIAVVMLTGVGEKTGIRTSSKDMKDFYGEEPDAYIEKPIEPAVLQSTVSKVLGL